MAGSTLRGGPRCQLLDYSRALAALRDDTRAGWEEQLGWEADDYDEGQTLPPIWAHKPVEYAVNIRRRIERCLQAE
jgi:hypothetical protein